MKRTALLFALCAGSLLVAGCSSQRGPAQRSVADAEDALDAVRGDASRYVPVRLEVADSRLAEIKADLATRNYDAVLANAPGLRRQVSDLQDAVIARRTQLAAAAREWEDLSEAVPPLVDAIQNRVDNLVSRQLPADVRPETVESARTTLREIQFTWSEASAAAKAGRTTEAAQKGRVAQAEARQVSRELDVSA